MKILLWIFFITQGIILYLLVGFFVNYIDSLIDHYDWKEDYRNNPKGTITLLFMWPFYIIICMIVAPFRFIKWVLDRLTEEKVKKYSQICPYCHTYFKFMRDDIYYSVLHTHSNKIIKYIKCPSCDSNIIMKGEDFNV